MKEIQPVNQNVLIGFPAADSQKMTASGIIIPATVETPRNSGNVVAISNIENPEVAVGDTVLFNEMSGKEIEFESQKYLMLPYSDIIAKIVETESI